MKKFLIFSQKKAFLVFHETEAPPKKIPYISGNWNSKKLFINQERGSKHEKKKKTEKKNKKNWANVLNFQK